MNILHYAKTFGPLVVALLVTLLTFTRDEPLGGPAGWLVPSISILLALGNVFMTYRADNVTWFSTAKAVVNVIHAGLQAVLLAVVATVCVCITGLGVKDWSTVGLALVGAAAVWLFPNEPKLELRDYVDPTPPRHAVEQ